MAGEIASAFVRIRPKMDGFQAETESGVKKAFKDIAKIAAGAFAAEKVFDFGKEITKGAAQVQKSTEQIRAGFGTASESVIKFNETAAAKLGLSAAAGESAAAKFSILFDNLGIGQKKSAEMTIGFEKLATSIASIKGVDPSEVMDKFTAAAAGSTRGLKSLGIVIDTNAIKQEALRLGLLKTAGASAQSRIADEQVAIAKANLTAAEKKYGDNTTQVAAAQIKLQTAQLKANAESNKVVGSLTPAAKAQAIYALATKDLAEKQAQAKAHSGDLIDVQRRLSAEWSNAKDSLGKQLLPVVAQLGGWLADKLPGAFSLARTAARTTSDFIRDHVAGPFEILRQHVYDLGTALVNNLQTPFDQLRDRARQVGDRLTDLLPSMDSVRSTANSIADAMKAAVNFTQQYQNVLLPLGGALGSMTLAFEAWTVATEVWTAVTEIATAAQEAFDIALSANVIGIVILAIAGLVGALTVLYQRSQTVQEIVDKTWRTMRQTAVEVWGFIGPFVIGQLKVIKDYVVGTFNVVRASVELVWNAIRIYITQTIKIVRDVINIAMALITGDWGRAWQGVKNLAHDALGLVTGEFHTFIHGFTAIAGAFGKMVENIFGDMWTGIRKTFSGVFDWLQEKAIKVALKIVEPFSHLPKWLGGGWAQDMKRNLTDSLDALKNPAATAGTAVATSFSGALTTTVSNAMTVMITKAQAALAGLATGAAVNAEAAAKAAHGVAVTRGAAGSSASHGGGSLSFKAGVNMTDENPMIMEGLKAAAAAGYQVLVTSGFRTFQEQAQLYARYVKSGFDRAFIAAKPGTSNHERGLAADVFVNGKPVDASAGALAILRKYGLVSDVAGDHPHLDLTGYGGGGGGGGGGNDTPLVVGSVGSTAKTAAQRAAERAAALKQQIANQRATLEQGYKTVAHTAKELGDDMSAKVKAQMKDVRSDIAHVSSKADVAKAKAELGDLRTAVTDALKKLRTEIALTNTFNGLKKEVLSLHGYITPQIKAQMKEIQSEIGKVSTPAQVAAIKAQMAKVKAEVKAGLDAMNKLIAADKATFERLWSNLATGADNAFDKATQKMLRDLQVTVKGAFDSFQFGGDLDKTPTEIALQQLQDTHDAANAQAQLAADQAQLATDQAAGDQTAITASAQKVADDLYQIQVASMQKQAQVEREAATQQLADAQTAVQQQRDLLKQQMDERVALIEQGMEDGTIKAADGMKALADVFGDPAYGIDIKNSGLILGGKLYDGLAEGLKPVFEIIKRLQDEMRKAGIKIPGGGSVPSGGTGTSAAALAAAAAVAAGVPLDPAIVAALGAANEPLLAELQRQTEIAQAQLNKPNANINDVAAIAFGARR